MVNAKWYGRVVYEQAWKWQKRLVVERRESALPDELLLLEHPPVYTLGRSGKESNLLFDEARREAEGITLHWVDRGGDITYHGPGQLVGYPIMNLKRLYKARGLPRPDLHLYLRELEEVIIQTLSVYGVKGWRYPGYTGVWVGTAEGPRKIAAIGIKVSGRGISSHGFALNVNPNLEHFAGIIPCGIEEHGVTSLSKLLDRPITVTDVIPDLITAFGEVLQVEIANVSA